MLQWPCLLFTLVSAITLYFVVRQRRSHASCCRLCMRFAFSQGLRVSSSSQGNFKSFKWDFFFLYLFLHLSIFLLSRSPQHIKIFVAVIFFQKESLTSTSSWWSHIYFLLMTCEMNIRKLLLLFRWFLF